jgi:hypothetical protein
MISRKNPSKRRSAATLAETAIVLNATMFLLIGLIVIGLGVFRYQQVAAVAREAARWASVHGGQYAQDTGQPIATPRSVYNAAILPMSSGLDPNSLTYTVSWDDPSEMPLVYNGSSSAWKSNAVKVTISYQWIPEATFGGLISGKTFTSTSEMPVTY